MDGEVIGLIVVVIAHGGLLWYKMANCENEVKRLARKIDKDIAGKQEGKHG